MNTQPTLFTPQNTALTPMMQQYMTIKAQHREHLVFYRLGDFYELFLEDAQIASSILDIVLTSRGKGQECEVPMCGVPAHSYEQYLEKLIKAGKSVAICEQLESPEEAKKRGAKSVVKREVVRIVTPGTVIEDSLVGKSANLVLSLFRDRDNIHIVTSDISTGVVFLQVCPVNLLRNEILRLQPKEILIAEHQFANSEMKKQLEGIRQLLTIRASAFYSLNRSIDSLKRVYQLHDIQSLSLRGEGDCIALGALSQYLEHTYKLKLPRLSMPQYLEKSHYMEIDASTRSNLELISSASGDTKKCLFAVIDKTATSLGGRLLFNRLNNPLVDPKVISARFDDIDSFLKDQFLMDKVRSKLTKIPDLERLLGKVYAQRAQVKDLISLKLGLEVAFALAELLNISISKLSANLKNTLLKLGNFGDLLEYLDRALNEETIQGEGVSFIRPGFSEGLDHYLKVKHNSKDIIANLREEYRARTGVMTLKISFNNVMGYFVEVTNANAAKLNSDEFILKQNLVGNSRFVTHRLNELQNELLNCEQRIVEIEQGIMKDICNKILKYSEQIASSAEAVAIIDVSASLAALAKEKGFVRPIVDDSIDIKIEGGWHPLVKEAIGDKFVANDLTQQESNRVWLITGPNMTGKSTFLRQNALIIILAQMGSFVPARSAQIGVVDKLFSRIGAADDLFAGNSTFMVEMIETANILNNASKRSFLILDEVGRGTSTTDGLAIAQSILENIHDNIKARTLFATHYHELTGLEEQLGSVECYTVSVKEFEDEVIFLHKVVKGKADQSYGIHVAKMAGLPEAVIRRAKELSKIKVPLQASLLESSEILEQNLPQIVELVRAIEPNDLSPKQALDWIYKLKEAA